MRGPNGVYHISMYFRDHYHLTKQNDFIKLENQILGKGIFLHGCCVKYKVSRNFSKGMYYELKITPEINGLKVFATYTKINAPFAICI